MLQAGHGVLFSLNHHIRRFGAGCDCDDADATSLPGAVLTDSFAGRPGVCAGVWAAASGANVGASTEVGEPAVPNFISPYNTLWARFRLVKTATVTVCGAAPVYLLELPCVCEPWLYAGSACLMAASWQPHGRLMRVPPILLAFFSKTSILADDHPRQQEHEGWAFGYHVGCVHRRCPELTDPGRVQQRLCVMCLRAVMSMHGLLMGMETVS
jgi:hypothetical protein